MNGSRLVVALAAGLAALALSACGETEPKPALGTEGNPLTAVAPGEGADVPAGEPSTGKQRQDAPGYEALVKGQSSTPQERFTPCNLVTQREAEAIVGRSMEVPVEAPQGPTCIYRPRSGDQLIALAVQEADIAKLRPRIKHLREIDVSDRAGYCGSYGQPMLYLPVAAGRVLSINAPCDIARDFAVKALPHL